MHVTQYVNSFVNRPGNIGVRTGHILKYLKDGSACVCRGAQNQVTGVEYRQMGALGHIPRILNGLRIRFAPEFNHRKWDLALYESYALRQSRTISTNIAHVWDACPKLIRLLKNRGIPVILDIPIAPSLYGEQLYQTGKADFLRGSTQIQDLEQQAISEADLIIAPSEFVAGVIRQMGVCEDRITIIEFGVKELVAKSEITKSSIARKSGIDYCFFGNINRRKGVPELLEAWSDPEFKEDRLHLCGRVNLDVKDKLKRSTASSIFTPGFVAPFEYMKTCDVFVLPSWLEGSAKAVYEAMACGLPSIVTHSTGSIVRDGVDGFVIDAGDVESLRDRMLWFKCNPEQIRVMGDAAKKRAKEFTWESYASKVIKTYIDTNNKK
jgi:glycosyltransferase involved in cell wall biosynthesis